MIKHILHKFSSLISYFCKMVCKYYSNCQAPNILWCFPAQLTHNCFFGLGLKMKINTSNKQLKWLQALYSFLWFQRHWVYKWGQKSKMVIKLKTTIKLYFRKKPQTFTNTWILKISINKDGKMLATCFKRKRKTMSSTKTVFSQETVAGVMTSPLEAENTSFT